MTLLGEDGVRSISHQDDPVACQKTFALLEELKNLEYGWQLCMNALTAENTHNSHLQFFAFQIIEHYIKSRYSSASVSEQLHVRQFVRQWIQLLCLPKSQLEPRFILNKAAQIFAMIFVRDYPQRWPSFFNDIVETLNFGTQAVDIYIRLLKAIDCEVADREILRSPADSHRNSKIKDAMREFCVPKLVETWYQILKSDNVEQSDLVCQCLEVVGAYVSWIDITLVANEQFIQRLIHLVLYVQFREAAIDCLFFIISKGMEPIDKLQLVESLVAILEKEGILKPLKEDESDYTSKVGRLLNGIGLTLIEGYNKLLKDGSEEQAKLVFCAIQRKVPAMLDFLKNDYDDVSVSVFEFCKEYIHLLKGKSINSDQMDFLQSLLLTIAHKMKFDSSYNFEVEGEDEAIFQDYRKQLKIILDNIAGVNKELVIEFIKKFVDHILWQWRESSFQDVEVALSLFYYIGEAIPSVGGNHFAGDHTKASAMHTMMITIVTSAVSSHPHPAVTLQYLETVVRYEKFFVSFPEHIPELLLTFLDVRGMRNKSSKVRSRSAYLFSRLVKSLKSSITSPLAISVLSSLHDYLFFAIPGSVLIQKWVSEDDQLFLYEASSVLIVSTEYPMEQKAMAFQELLFPVLEKYTNMVEELMIATDIHRQEILARGLCHAMAVTTRASKAFSNRHSMKICGCVQVFVEALKVFLTCLHVSNQTFILQSNIRQLLHRMVVCLEDEILPFIPEATQGLLKNSDITSVKDYLPLIVQIISKFKKNIVPFLQQAFTPIVNAVFTSLATPEDENDEEVKREKQLLKRNYFQFVAAIVSNSVVEVFNNVESTLLEQVMMSVIQGAVDVPDPISQKICFSILKKFVELSGGKDLHGDFSHFIYKSIVPACVLAPLRNTFDLSDAQTLVALSESTLCLKAIYEKMGDKFLGYIQNEYFPSLQIPPILIHEYCTAIKSENKVFKDYVKLFSQRMRT